MAYKKLLEKMMSLGNWHYDPTSNIKDAVNISPYIIEDNWLPDIKDAVNSVDFSACVWCFKEEEDDYENNVLAWTKLDHRSHGYNNENTKYKQIQIDNNDKPYWAESLLKQAEKKGLKEAYLGVNMQVPGTVNPWHFDTYQRLKSGHFNFGSEKEFKNIRRHLIFPENWHWGHFFQVGNSVVSNWKAGDAVTWEPLRYHLACNAGIKPKYTISITGKIDT